MRIKLSPQRRDDDLQVTISGDTLVVNGELFDFSRMADGDSLPRSAILSQWFDGGVEKVDGQLTVTLLLPNPWNYSPEQAFPVDLVDVPDGPVIFPQSLPDPAPEIGEALSHPLEEDLTVRLPGGAEYVIPAGQTSGDLK